MRRKVHYGIYSCVLLLTLTACGGGSSPAVNPAIPSPRMGAISYWALNAAAYDQLPAGALAVVNPSNGIFSGQTTTLTTDVASYAAIVSSVAARNVSMLGYVPTGYFDHTCNVATQCQTLARIEAQVQAYFQNMPGLGGIFFDEVSVSPWNCAVFPAEYQRLRDIVHKYNAQAKIAFNTAVPETCVMDAANAGEIVVLFESTQSSYQSGASQVAAATAAARAKGVASWHLVFGATDLNSAYAQANAAHANWLYVTDVSGGNIWNSLPGFWAQELALTGY